MGRRSLLPTYRLRLLDLTNGARQRKVPWRRINNHREDYIKAKYLPEGIEFRQFHHIVQDDASVILKHWAERQAAGRVPLKFKGVAAAIQSSEDEEGGADTESDEETGQSEDEDDAQSGDEASKWRSSPAGSTRSGDNAAYNSSRVGCLLDQNGRRC